MPELHNERGLRALLDMTEAAWPCFRRFAAAPLMPTGAPPAIARAEQAFKVLVSGARAWLSQQAVESSAALEAIDALSDVGDLTDELYSLHSVLAGPAAAAVGLCESLATILGELASIDLAPDTGLDRIPLWLEHLSVVPEGAAVRAAWERLEA